MGYIKQNFVDNKTILKASHLINIENAIIENEKNIESLYSGSSESEPTSDILVYKPYYLFDSDGNVIKEGKTVDKTHPFNFDPNTKYSFSTTAECKYLPYYSYESTGKAVIEKQDADVYEDYLVGGDGYGYITLQKWSTCETLGRWQSDKIDVLGGGRGQPHNNSVTCITPKNPIEFTYILGGKTIVTATGLENSDATKYAHITLVNSVDYDVNMSLSLSPEYSYTVFCYDKNGTYLGNNQGIASNISTAAWVTGDKNIPLNYLSVLHPTIKTIKLLYKLSTAAADSGNSASTPEQASFSIHKSVYTGLPRYYSNCYSDRDYNKGTLCVYDFYLNNGEYSHKMVQLIRIDFIEDELWTSIGGSANDTRPYGNFVVDEKNGYLYAIAMKTADNLTRFFKFKLPLMTEGVYDSSFDCNVVTLSQDDIIEYWDSEYCYSIQGCTFYQNQIFVTEGFDATDARQEMPRIRIFDVNFKKQVAVFDIYEHGLTLEPEVIFWNKGQCYYANRDKAILKLNLYTI